MCVPSLNCPSGLGAIPAAPRSSVLADELPLGDPAWLMVTLAQEVRVAEIWTAILGVPEGEEPGTFADMGGDAMAALKIAARVRSELGVPVEPGDLYVHQDLASFVRHVLTGGVAGPD